MNGRVAKKIRREAIKASDKLTPEVFQIIHTAAQGIAHDEEYIKGGAEYFDPMDASGGNYDDAYDLGVNDGEVHFARRLLREVNKISGDAE